MTKDQTEKAKQEDPGFRVEDKRASTQDESQSDPEETKDGSSAPESPPGESSHFSRFMASLHMTSLYHLGLIPGPSGDRPQPNLQLARENIDIMADLQKKTEGNLTEDEVKLVKHLLNDARQRYLQSTMQG